MLVAEYATNVKPISQLMGELQSHCQIIVLEGGGVKIREEMRQIKSRGDESQENQFNDVVSRVVAFKPEDHKFESQQTPDFYEMIFPRAEI